MMQNSAPVVVASRRHGQRGRVVFGRKSRFDEAGQVDILLARCSVFSEKLELMPDKNYVLIFRAQKSTHSL